MSSDKNIRNDGLSVRAEPLPKKMVTQLCLNLVLHSVFDMAEIVVSFGIWMWVWIVTPLIFLAIASFMCTGFAFLSTWFALFVMIGKWILIIGSIVLVLFLVFFLIVLFCDIYLFVVEGSKIFSVSFPIWRREELINAWSRHSPVWVGKKVVNAVAVHGKTKYGCPSFQYNKELSDKLGLFKDIINDNCHFSTRWTPLRRCFIFGSGIFTDSFIVEFDINECVVSIKGPKFFLDQLCPEKDNDYPPFHKVGMSSGERGLVIVPVHHPFDLRSSFEESYIDQAIKIEKAIDHMKSYPVSSCKGDRGKFIADFMTGTPLFDISWDYAEVLTSRNLPTPTHYRPDTFRDSVMSDFDRLMIESASDDIYVALINVNNSNVSDYKDETKRCFVKEFDQGVWQFIFVDTHIVGTSISWAIYNAVFVYRRYFQCAWVRPERTAEKSKPIMSGRGFNPNPPVIEIEGHLNALHVGTHPRKIHEQEPQDVTQGVALPRETTQLPRQKTRFPESDHGAPNSHHPDYKNIYGQDSFSVFVISCLMDAFEAASEGSSSDPNEEPLSASGDSQSSEIKSRW